MSGTDCEVYIMAKSPVVSPSWGSRSFMRPCKVGITQNLGARLTQVRTSCPFAVGIAWSFSFLDRATAETVEVTFHIQQRPRRLHGEWFDMDHIEAMRSLCVISRRATPKGQNFEDYLQFSGVDWTERRFGFRPMATMGGH